MDPRYLPDINQKEYASDITARSRKIESAFNDIEKSVNNLKNSVTVLRRCKNKCMIHSHQFEKDLNLLTEMYHTLEDKYNVKPKEETPSNIEQKPDFPPMKNNVLVKDQKSDNFQKMHLIHNIEWKMISHSQYVTKGSVKLRFAFFVPAVLCSVQFDPSGKMIAFSDGRNLHLISPLNGELLFSHEIPRSPDKNELYTRVIRFSKNGQYIAVSSKSNEISIFSVAQQSFIGNLKDAHQSAVSSLLFLNDNITLLSGSYDGNLCIWNISTMQLVKMLHHGSIENEGKLNKEGAIVSIASNNEENFVAVGFMNGWIGLYDKAFKQPMNKFKAHSEYLLSVDVFPQSDQIISTSQDKTAKIWQVRGVATCEKTFSGHMDYLISVTFPYNSPKVELLFTGSKDENIKGWDVKTGENLFTIVIHKNTIFELHHHPLENTFVSCSGDGLICVWDYNLNQL
ncbi:Transcriptional repressor tup12-related protein [Histomonas meleagridis]|uniref:Transcriptional repressor tup12-related protein n=1 Tax=Histomonas meleagridis TaxID=135588 RepID=UPI0035597F3E|nr:Transcriptional repressor tup12-related protein [Histomonas meleagridis]KAH0806923.1 Transcriptional repressor tup12-related protein [Histomonas meleagridis]